MTEYERIREEIDNLITKETWKRSPFSTPNEIADQILSLDGIEIKATDQSLPEIICKDIQMPVVRQATALAQKDMLKAGFVKVIPKGR